MMRAWLTLCTALLLMGCEQQIRLGVEQTFSTVPTILEDNVAANLYRIRSNRYAIIAQASLKESVSNAQNSYNYGVAPNIALRAIAITGLTATAANSLSENWVANPVVGSIDQRRLQILFSYAVRPDHSAADNVALVRELVNTGIPLKPSSATVDPKKKPEETDQEKLEALIKSYLPPLPDRFNGPMATVDDPNCQNEHDFNLQLPLSLKHVCFKADKFGTGREKVGLLVLWSLALPEFSAFLSKSGDSKSTPSSLSVNANPPSLFTR